MGFRLYINDKISCGKLYGYNPGVKHLYSIDYLISINAFDQWLDFNELPELTYKVPSYDTMVDYFYIVQATDDIYLTLDEYHRFILLYTSDQVDEWGTGLETIREILNERLSVTPDENGKIKICWA